MSGFSRQLRGVLVWALGLSATLLGLGLPARADNSSFDFKLDLIKDRKDVTMADYAKRPLVVVVWSPECPHCRLQMPYINSLYNKLDNKTVDFLACSLGDQQQTYEYVKEMKLGFQVMYKAHKADYISDAFTKGGWPNTFVFGPNGSLIGSCDSVGQSYVSKVLAMVDKAAPPLRWTGHPATRPVAHAAALALRLPAPAVVPVRVPAAEPAPASLLPTTAPLVPPVKAEPAAPARHEPVGVPEPGPAPARQPKPEPAPPATPPKPEPAPETDRSKTDRTIH